MKGSDMKSFGLNAYQVIALGNHLSVGGAKNNGLFLNALQTGFFTNFQGCYLSELVTATPGPTYLRTSIDADLNPYKVHGVSQRMAVIGSNATAVAGAGFPDASAAGDTGVLRLTNNDTGTGVNGAAALAMWQENALWITPASSFTVAFDIAQWSQRTLGLTQAFSEFGVVGTAAQADLIDAAKVPGWIDGTNDKVSCYLNGVKFVEATSTLTDKKTGIIVTDPYQSVSTPPEQSFFMIDNFKITQQPAPTPTPTPIPVLNARNWVLFQ
jgi:hypothetical protein